MKIAIVSGSHRQNSESDRVSKYLEARADSVAGASTYLFSLGGNPLPLWDEETRTGGEKWREVWGPVSAELHSSDGFVIVSPEWSGMVPSGLKNFFLLCQSGELAHKPGLIVTVSSGIGGSYPVAELRQSSYKNTRICYIPDHVIVRTSPQMLKGESATEEHDKQLRARIDYSLRLLGEYSKAFRAVRGSGVIDSKSFPYGM